RCRRAAHCNAFGAPGASCGRGWRESFAGNGRRAAYVEAGPGDPVCLASGRRTMARGRWFIGTSGWSYRHWRGPFYPADMANGAEQLRFYVARFDTVEVNGTFYRLIEVETFRRWREATPAGFVFACKGSRYLTHMKRLKDPVPGVGRFFERVEALEDKLGPVVFQLPGRFKPDRDRLERFIEA